MRGNELLEKMALIDPAYVEAADQKPVRKKTVWIKWAAMAACFCLIIGVIQLAQGVRNMLVAEPTVPGLDHTTQGEDEWDLHLSTTGDSVPPLDEYVSQGTLIYNEATSFVSADRMYIPGYFTQELNDKEIAAIVSEQMMTHMQLSGSAGFDGTGKLLNIHLEINGPFLENSVNLIYHIGALDSCYVLFEKPAVCTYNGIDFTVYQWSADGREYLLDAYAQIGDWSMQVDCTAAADELDNAKLGFETLLRCLADFGSGMPDFSAIVAEEIPEFFDRSLNHDEAQKDATYGSYMVQMSPDGFAEESIRRYKDQNHDFLSGLWTKDLAELSWYVSKYDEADANRLTSVAEIENYDLSLYPIPRAESVPDELREIVNDPIFDAKELTLDTVYKRAYKVDDAGDIDGWRMMFSVRYGDVLVAVRAKGIEPEWIFQQLMSLLD